jgi:hypothetical protein
MISRFHSIPQHTSAYLSIPQHTSAYLSIPQHTSAYLSIPQHTSYVSIAYDQQGMGHCALMLAIYTQV